MKVIRLLLGLAGTALALVGLWKLYSAGWTSLVHVVTWLLGGVIAHDGVLAPLVVVLGVLVVRMLPDWARMPVVAGFVVLGSATLMAIPVLGRFGERPDNPSLLDRNYTAGWLVLAVLTAGAVAAGCWWNLRLSRSQGGGHGADLRRRTAQGQHPSEEGTE